MWLKATKPHFKFKRRTFLHFFYFKMAQRKVTPSELKGKISKLKTDVIKEAKKGKDLKMEQLRIDENAFCLEIDGEVTTNGILVSNEYGTHSLGFKFNDDDDKEGFEELNSVFDDLKGIEDWNVKDVLRDDVLWLKLKPKKDKNSYKFNSNMKMSPKKPQDAMISAFQNIRVIVEVSAYFHLKNKFCGISLAILSLDKR